MSFVANLLTPIHDADWIGAFGAKATHLAQLARWGYRTPKGFVIPDTLFQRHLRNCGVAEICREVIENLRDLELEQVRQKSHRIREAIRGTPLPSDLQSAISGLYQSTWQGKLLAVRSSAAEEDSDDASFAGQLDSVLGVDSLIRLDESVRLVWASLWSERSLLYGQRRGNLKGRMGVILQEQIDARYSGVVFTCDPFPSHGKAQIIIEYIQGLGNRLVSGEVTPSRAHICKRDFILTRFRQDDESADLSLSEETLVRLAKIGLDLEQRYGKPQDIEWSTDYQGDIVLLQTRSITKYESDQQQEVWSNANIAENFPAPISPFLYSIVSRSYTAYFRNLGLGFGISRKRISAMSKALQNIVGLHYGRLYYNLTNIHTVIHLAPFGRWLANGFNQFTGACEFPRICNIDSGTLERMIDIVRIVIKTTCQYLFIQRRVTNFERMVDRYAEKTRPLLLNQKELPKLALDLEAFLDIRLNRWNSAALADTAAMVSYGLLKHLLSRNIPETNDVLLHHHFLAGLSNLASAKSVEELWRLSRWVRNNERMQEIFLSSTAKEINQYQTAPEWYEFKEKFDRYLSDWGFRYSQELMLTSPTPQEDPLPVIQMLQNYVREEGLGPNEVVQNLEQIRQRKTKEMAEQLAPSIWFSWLPFTKEKQFQLVLKWTQGAIRLRERARMKQALLYTRLRHVMLCMGHQFVKNDLIKNQEDIFFLTVDEIQGLLVKAPSDSTEIWKKIIKERKAAQEKFDRVEPPDRFELPFGKEWRPEVSAKTVVENLQNDRLRGTGACGGIVTGSAAVLPDVTDADRICKGDILVTRQTDPGWATVFFLIKGLVIERGGMLSHGAIIAREYGIPAVVGVLNATQRIQSGDELRVDGDNGVVEFVRH